MPVDQMGLFLRGETVRKLLDDIGHEEVIDVNVTDVWDEKIFDPLPLAAEHTAQQESLLPPLLPGGPRRPAGWCGGIELKRT